MANLLARTALLAVLTATALGAQAYAGEPSGFDRSAVIRVADAIPSMAQVENAVRAQNWTQAETMLKQVVAAKPQSAKAWYFLAQTEEKLGKKSQAQTALGNAENIDPSLKFASPGAVQSMHSRLGQSSSAAQNRQQSPQSLPGYANRPAIGSGSGTTALAVPANAPPPAPASHAWIYVLLALIALGGAGYYFVNKRSKAKALEDSESTRKALLARANGVQERASSLVKTARFEDQASSSFGASAQACVSKANSVLGRLKVYNATVNAYTDGREIEELEHTVETLEGQAARKAWNDAPSAVSHQEPALSAVAPSPMAAPAQASGFGGSAYPQPAGYPQPSGYPQPAGYPMQGGYAQPMQQGPTTVVVHDNSGPGLLQTMILADAMRDHHRHDDREYERDARHRAEQNSYAPAYAEPTYNAPAAPARDSSSFDFGGGSADNSSSSWDSGSSSSSSSSTDSSTSWDSGSSSDSSSSSSSSSSNDDSNW